MITKIPADLVNRVFEEKLWKRKKLVCGVCKTDFQYEPWIYTYPDGLQSICCSEKCHSWIRREMKARSNIGGATDEP